MHVPRNFEQFQAHPRVSCSARRASCRSARKSCIRSAPFSLESGFRQAANWSGVHFCSTLRFQRQVRTVGPVNFGEASWSCWPLPRLDVGGPAIRLVCSRFFRRIRPGGDCTSTSTLQPPFSLECNVSRQFLSVHY